ncbi:LEA type 2 family protein [Kangiella sp. TOML190]|uniref:LEA type 2 family protein n=1 Tax=Kangiella sp. TOML190 TaxID=2931351 RepID=UPI0020408729|nr:LEA type 2 family protein [Kangiella sp. TOML190]
MRFVSTAFIFLVIIFINSCATWRSDYQAPDLSLVNITMLESQGFEQLYEVKLRIQNPNDLEFPIKGMSYRLNLMGAKFATGVNDDKILLKPFSEEVVTFKVTTNWLQAGRALLNLSKQENPVVDYSMNAKIHTDKLFLGTIPVEKVGKLELESLFNQESN